MPPHPLYTLTRFFTQTFWLPPAPTTHPNSPVPAYIPLDLSTKTYLITGGYGGLGLAIVAQLYSHHANVWIAGRSASKAADAIEKLQAEHPDSKGRLLFLEVDFSDLASIKPAVQEFLRRNGAISGQGNGEGGNLHWLNLNHGIMTPDQSAKGAQGHDMTFATNIYGPFLFAKLLRPVLRDTARRSKPGEVRVSWAGSVATYLSGPVGGVEWIDVEDDGKDNRRDLVGHDDVGVAYMTSKAANYYLSCEFGRRFGVEDGVLHNVSGFKSGFLRASVL
jgi:retinol dehydrogenase 12